MTRRRHRPRRCGGNLRTAVWRRLKGFGAVNVAHLVAALPESPQAERSLRVEVGQMSGAAQLVRAEPPLRRG